MVQIPEQLEQVPCSVQSSRETCRVDPRSATCSALLGYTAPHMVPALGMYIPHGDCSSQSENCAACRACKHHMQRRSFPEQALYVAQYSQGRHCMQHGACSGWPVMSATGLSWTAPHAAPVLAGLGSKLHVAWIPTGRTCYWIWYAGEKGRVRGLSCPVGTNKFNTPGLHCSPLYKEH